MAYIDCRRPEGEELLGDCVTREYPNHRRRINAHHRSITRGADEVLRSRVDFFSTLSAQRLSVAIQTLMRPACQVSSSLQNARGLPPREWWWAAEGRDREVMGTACGYHQLKDELVRPKRHTAWTPKIKIIVNVIHVYCIPVRTWPWVVVIDGLSMEMAR